MSTSAAVNNLYKLSAVILKMDLMSSWSYKHNAAVPSILPAVMAQEEGLTTRVSGVGANNRKGLWVGNG
jgi:hypothetical protein